MFLKVKHVEVSGIVDMLNWTWNRDVMGCDTIVGWPGERCVFVVLLWVFSSSFGFALSLNFIESLFCIVRAD